MGKRNTRRVGAGTRSASALSDHAKVRGVSRGRANKKRGERKRTFRESARRGLTVVASVVGLSGLVYGGVALNRWAKVSPRFAIERIEVSGMDRAEEAILRRMLGVEAGDNLVGVDSEQVRERLLVHPWLSDVTVDKRYPRGLSIEVVEYVPVAMVALDNLYYADANAEIVKRYSPGEQVDLPVVTGLTRDEIESADPGAQARLEGALGFLDAWRAHYGDEAPVISELHVDPVMGLAMVLAEDEARVELGDGPYEEKIARWGKVKATLTARGVVASRVTLGGAQHPERVVAKLSARRQVAKTRAAGPIDARSTSAPLAAAR